MPLYDIQRRWIDRFERPLLQALSAVKRRAEEQDMAERPAFMYVTYIQSTAERVWHALTSADLTAAYWGHSNVSDWQPGSRWEHRRTDGSGIADVVGTVLANLKSLMETGHVLPQAPWEMHPELRAARMAHNDGR